MKIELVDPIGTAIHEIEQGANRNARSQPSLFAAVETESIYLRCEYCDRRDTKATPTHLVKRFGSIYRCGCEEGWRHGATCPGVYIGPVSGVDVIGFHMENRVKGRRVA